MSAVVADVLTFVGALLITFVLLGEGARLVARRIRR